MSYVVLQTYISFIQGHALMNFYFRSKRHSDGLNHLVLRLPVWPFSGLFGEAAIPSINLPPFCRGWILPWNFLFYNMCSPTPWIFALAGLSAVSNLDILRVSAIFAHSLSCGSPICSLGVSLWLSCLSDVLRGDSEVVWGTWCLTSASWGAPLVYEGVRHYRHGSKMLGESNGAINPLIYFW